jgi:hypothetical protein
LIDANQKFTSKDMLPSIINIPITPVLEKNAVASCIAVLNVLYTLGAKVAV